MTTPVNDDPNKTSTFAALRNPLYRKLWFAVLLSGTCVAADGTAATWTTRSNTYRIELMLPSWTGYLLQRQRLTKAEQEIIKKVWRLHVGEQIPLERYYLCVNMKLEARQMPEAHASGTPTTPRDLGAQQLPGTS
jgi:hypothetical protein